MRTFVVQFTWKMVSNEFVWIFFLINFISINSGTNDTLPLCRRLAYVDKCPDGRQSQFTIRWYLRENMCTSYSFGYCVDTANLTRGPSLRTRASCEVNCMRRNLDTTAILKTKATLLVASLRSTENYHSANYSCERRPFVRTCPSGSPSRFTFRWYFDGGFCLAYAYGMCKEDETDKFYQKIPKTKQICELFCNTSNYQSFPTPKPYPLLSNHTTKIKTSTTFPTSTTAISIMPDQIIDNHTVTPYKLENDILEPSKKSSNLFSLDDDPVLGPSDTLDISEKEKFGSSFDFERGYVRQLSSTKSESENESNFTWYYLFDPDFAVNTTVYNLTTYEQSESNRSLS